MLLFGGKRLYFLKIGEKNFIGRYFSYTGPKLMFNSGKCSLSVGEQESMSQR